MPEAEKSENDADNAGKTEKSYEAVPGPMSFFLMLWRVVYPVLIHAGTSFLVLIAFTAFYLEQVKAGAQFDILDKVVKSSLLQLIPTSVAAGGISLFFYRRDQKKRKAGFLGQEQDFVWSPPVIWFSVIALTTAGSQILNDLINIFRLNEIFPSYAEMSEDTMVGQPVWLLILVIGILAPIAEELIFRGLIFRRLKDYVKPWIAVVISSLVFGLYHGNMVQFLYASLLGVLLAIIYQRTGTLWAAIAAHMAVNLWSMFGGEWWHQFWGGIPYGTWIGILIELLLCVIPGYWIFVNKRGE